MNKIDRLKIAVKQVISKGVASNQKELGRLLGYTNESSFSQIMNGRVPLPGNFLEKLKNLDPSLDVDWINTGEQINTDGTITTGKIIPLFDAEAAAGNAYGVSMEAARPVSMIEIGGLLKDSESALRVYGNSMTPNYPAGCVVGLRRHSDRFIEPGYVYVIETGDNRYLKRLYYNRDRTAFRCVSDNHMIHESGPMTGEFYYPDFEIPFEEVKRLFRVVGVIKRNIL